eukprot:11664756-Prorocentrum_lima.AAC.1
MTSSLVGSEMCIRDSEGTEPEQVHALRINPPIYNTHKGAQMKGKLAVSYTHLTLPTICSV